MEMSFNTAVVMRNAPNDNRIIVSRQTSALLDILF